MLPKFKFSFLQWANVIGPSLKKQWNYGGSPKPLKVLFWSIEFLPPLASLYKWKKGEQHLPKAHEIKVRCYWELFGGTCQELGNSFASSIHPPSSPQEKKSFIFHFSAEWMNGWMNGWMDEWVLLICSDFSMNCDGYI